MGFVRKHRNPVVPLALSILLAGCTSALDQDRPTPHPRPAAGPAVATGARTDDARPLPGQFPPPKPFIAASRFDVGEPAHPSALLLAHAQPEQPVPLSTYARQPTHDVDDFGLSPDLTAAAVRQRLGPPAALAVVDDPWAVYRLTGGRELWLHFADGGTGSLFAADVVQGREDGYSRDRLYPHR